MNENPSLSLEEKAEKLKRLSEEHAHLRKNAKYIDGLRTRRDDLKNLEGLVSSVAQIKRILMDLIPSPSCLRDLQGLRQNLQDLSQRFSSQPKSIIEPGALEIGPYLKLLTEMTVSYMQAWHDYAKPGDRGLAIQLVLDKYPTFHTTVRVIKEIRNEMEGISNQLPKTKDDIRALEELRTKLADEISSLEGKGLNEQVVDFLRRSAKGVPLNEVLTNPQVLEWIKNNNLTPHFRVFC